MASSGLVDIAPQRGVSVIAIKGAVHHLMGSLAPAAGQQPKFAQLYIIDDPDQEVQSRMAALGQAGLDLDAELLRDMQAYLHANNTYVRDIKQAKVRVDQSAVAHGVVAAVCGRRLTVPLCFTGPAQPAGVGAGHQDQRQCGQEALQSAHHKC